MAEIGSQNLNPQAGGIITISLTDLLEEARALEAAKLYTEAIAVYQRVLSLRPGHVHAEVALGINYQRLGRLRDAEQCYARVLEKRGDLFSIHNNRGVILLKLGRNEEARDSFLAALALSKDLVEAHRNLGKVFRHLKEPGKAVESFRAVIALRPGTPQDTIDLGHCLIDAGQANEAEIIFRTFVGLIADNAAAWHGLGTAQLALGKGEEAVASLRRAIGIAPTIPHLTSLAGAYQKNGDPLAAIAAYRELLRHFPDDLRALVNVGILHQRQGAHGEALAMYDRAVQVNPTLPEARWNRSIMRLLHADAGGWEDYEARWQTTGFVFRSFPCPQWDGNPLPSGRLLVTTEQGIGEEIMFAALLPEIMARGVPCVVECSTRLIPLYRRSFPSVRLIGPIADVSTMKPPEIAATIPIGSLPYVLGMEGAIASPLLVADVAATASIRGRMAGDGLLVGVAWHTKNSRSGNIRSVPLEQIVPLTNLKGTRFVCLQYGDADKLAQDIAEAGAQIAIDREIDQMADLDAFAAQISAMDLVITIDNSTAHMAGALGIPTWLLVPTSPDWRWHLEREDCSWYPSMRLFRQSALGDWGATLDRVMVELTALAGGSTTARS